MTWAVKGIIKLAISQVLRKSGAHVKVLRAPWVRIASSVLSARGTLKRNRLLAESTLEAMRTQGHSPSMVTHGLFDAQPQSRAPNISFFQFPGYLVRLLGRFSSMRLSTG